MFFLITTTMANPNVVKVSNPRGTKDTKAKQNIVVSINKDQQFFIGQTPIKAELLDTLIKEQVARLRGLIDTPTVVVNADSVTFYGGVMQVMQAAKRAGARVVANVK
jgi:biopolymer transport protein ExbD